MSLSGIGWYAKVNELMIISEDPKVKFKNKQDLSWRQPLFSQLTARIYYIIYICSQIYVSIICKS